MQVQWLGDPLAPNSTTIDDRIFVSELLSHLTSTLCINESRVYAAGLSNGGGLTGLVMCDEELNRRLAAFATVAGAFYPDASLTEPLFQAECQPALQGRRLPYLNLHGLADTVVAYNGTNTPPPASIPVPTWVKSWVERNDCSSAPVVSEIEAGTVTESKWTCGGQQDTVVHRAIEGFGHGWPSKKNQGEPFETLRGGPTGWDATPLILEWFAKWTL
ncbi:carbohydrate esterase family 1 protein [Macroventuria anomochaeta]|uniref:Carbohydrate esterase family 1 protein n=1 Tax=Macroventuria anomochaeta TaxID=301207 RepID=A0ACB6S1K6_9PLEO|nr:carbohydrate esterase family 1 protein [Macroventuria anomochaeta]KAF2627278.1 carbohydrate esterase family 1 protein [Macroventuria anomochaeta]